MRRRNLIDTAWPYRADIWLVVKSRRRVDVVHKFVLGQGVIALEISMFERLRWLLVAAIVASPLTVDTRHRLVWSEASAQYLQCDPVVLNYFRSNQYTGSQVIPRSPPPSCVTPTCVLRGACISEIRLEYGLQTQSKLNPNGCLLRICTRPGVVGSGR